MSEGTERTFPVLFTALERRAWGHHVLALTSVPWAMLLPHEEQAKKNHGGQSLDVLASRGGLGPDEIVSVLEDRRWRPMPTEDALGALYRLVQAWRGRRIRASDPTGSPR